MYTGAFLPKIGGAELVVHHLAEGLAGIGVDVTVATFDKSNKSLLCNYKLRRLKTFKGLGLLSKIYKEYKFKGLGLFDKIYQEQRNIKLKNLIKQVQPDLIHVHYLYPTGYDIVKLKEKIGLKIPIVVTSHGIDIQIDKNVNYGLRLDPEIEKKILYTMNNVDKLVAIGNGIYQEYRTLGIGRDKIMKISNPIAHDILANLPDVSKKDFGIAMDIPVILAVGRNHPKKGFKNLVEIIKILHEKNFLVKCIFVGKNVSQLSKYAADLNISKSIFFFESALPVGVRYQGCNYAVHELIENFFNIADVYAMTSIIEGSPLVATEAMASGTPVIAMKAKGAVDLIKHNYNGLLINNNNEMFAEQIIALLSNREKSEEIGRNGQRESAKYSRKVVAKQHMTLYRNLINANPEPGSESNGTALSEKIYNFS